MSRPSSSCIFGSIGPVEVFERGSYIVGILLCFLKKTAGSMTYPPEPDHIDVSVCILLVTGLTIYFMWDWSWIAPPPDILLSELSKTLQNNEIHWYQ